ncbi:BTAD domain-containing putative transcriptional regulator [Mycetocola sp.]|jgi:DNA-binding SARP family transcriptional activator|uniref:AfsR/SARP family transcriptional regulator n=1 Tax=Mycetocola sp. TaxID=1871042 RepID=UPI002632439C|nr:BTAD domain-containing putative transcriptional regulator [Mycetocola sp.]MCU1559161.1 DNA-binding transcriptional activator of the family [Mycetocola sp.]
MGSDDHTDWTVRLFGFWHLSRDGHPVVVSTRQQRIIAALVVRGPQTRRSLASLLWPESSELQASGNLRASLYRVSHELPHLIGTFGDLLALEESARVDVYRVRELISAIERPAEELPQEAGELLRTADLLPGWYEDWVLFEQERLNQQRLSALDNLCRRALIAGHSAEAIALATIASGIEPLRERSQLLLVRSYLAADDRASALKCYQYFRGLIHRELGITPSPRFAELLGIPSETHDLRHPPGSPQYEGSGRSVPSAARRSVDLRKSVEN